MPEKTVTLSDADWQQLTAIIANATGYLAFQRLVTQLQAQEDAAHERPVVKGDGLDPDPPELPLGRNRTARAAEPGR